MFLQLPDGVTAVAFNEHRFTVENGCIDVSKLTLGEITRLMEITGAVHASPPAPEPEPRAIAKRRTRSADEAPAMED